MGRRVFGSPYQNDDFHIEMGIWASPYQYGDHHFEMGRPLRSNPHIEVGIAILIWGFVNPHIDMGIPISKRIEMLPLTPRIEWLSQFWYGDTTTETGTPHIEINCASWGYHQNHIYYCFNPISRTNTSVTWSLTTHMVILATLAIPVATGAAKPICFLARAAVCVAASPAVAMNDVLSPNWRYKTSCLSLSDLRQWPPVFISIPQVHFT